LASYGLAAPGSVELQLHISFLAASAERPAGYMMPDVITVEVIFGADIPPKLIQVTDTYLIYIPILCICMLSSKCPAGTK